MNARSTRTAHHSQPKTAAQAYRDWLALTNTEGPFLAVPELLRAWPSGMPPLKTLPQGEERLRRLHTCRDEFERAWDAWHHAAVRDDDEELVKATDRYRTRRDPWIEFVLTVLLDWQDDYEPFEPDAPATAEYRACSPDGAISAAPSGRLRMNGTTGALVYVTDPVASNLCDIPDDGWNANPIDRMQAMLRTPGSDCSIGLVTDGRWWALVSAPKDGPAAWGQFDSQMWIDTPSVRDAFVNLLSVSSLAVRKMEDRLPALFAGSVTAAEEITNALGSQVRRAVELIVAAFGESAAHARADGRVDPLPDGDEIYQAAVTVMMRTIFLLFAQERGLLPQGGMFDESYGMAGVLDRLEARAMDEGEETMDGTSQTWHRLLATSRALYQGANFEDMRLPAYGGSVFDPDRHPFLTAVNERNELAVTVSDRVMLHVLRSIQIAQVDKESRRVSFRDMDVEQIGYIYEGLLGYTCRRADRITLGLGGKTGSEPEMPLDELERIAAQSGDDPKGIKRRDAIQAWVKEHEPASEAVSDATLCKQLTSTASPEDERALLTITHDETLIERLRPWMPLIRRDLRDRPLVMLEGDLYVEETSSRKDAGAHYTPRALAEEVVEHALEPLVYKPGPLQTPDRSQWRHISSTALLNLHVADIACGSGAFLVAAARYLARELVEAWRQEGVLSDSDPEQTLVRATRKVVSSCLYGVDINDMAVEMCKLSLWLVSLDKTQPFSFVDNKILHGNSLLGVTSLAQVETMRIDAKQTQLHLLEMNHQGDYMLYDDTDMTIHSVRRMREQLSEEIDADDPQRSAAAKRRQMHEIDKALTRSRAIAAGLMADGKRGKELDDRYDDLLVAVHRAYPPQGEGDATMLDHIIDRGLTPTVPTDYKHWTCVHWPLEVPEVMDNGGFDAIIGNPPFLGGQMLTGAMGTNMREWLVNIIARGGRGSADLCAYFFLRAFDIMRSGGVLGLLATNTIAQGATRKVGLKCMMDEGFTIYRSIRSKPWPVKKSASLEYAAVWGIKGRIGDDVKRNCDGVNVGDISSLLEPQGIINGQPEKLKDNKGFSFIGCYVLGNGFVVSSEQANEWIVADSKNKDVLFPYLNGEDLNSRPDCSASRWVIDFNDWSEEKAKTYSLPYAHILQYVKPERRVNNRKVYREKWWQYAEKRPALRKAIASMEEVLAIARISNTLMPVRIKTGVIFNEMIVVFASDSYDLQAVLSSSLHQYWAIKFGSTLGTETRYTSSSIFGTFPRPIPTERLECIGRDLETERQKIMLRRQISLTDLYNLINDQGLAEADDADVARMREIHRELDEAVMDAYGWSDVALDYGFHEFRGVRRWTVCPKARVEILNRLLEENHRRAEAERKAGGTR